MAGERLGGGIDDPQHLAGGSGDVPYMDGVQDVIICKAGEVGDEVGSYIDDCRTGRSAAQPADDDARQRSIDHAVFQRVDRARDVAVVHFEFVQDRHQVRVAFA